MKLEVKTKVSCSVPGNAHHRHAGTRASFHFYLFRFHITILLKPQHCHNWPYRDFSANSSSPSSHRERGRGRHQMSCMSFSVFNSSQPVTMETVSWGELKTKNAVQIQVAAGVCLSHQRSADVMAEEGGLTRPVGPTRLRFMGKSGLSMYCFFLPAA